MAAANATGKPEQGINTENLFPLDTPEFAVRFRSATKSFRHIFRRITAADWEAYYDNVIAESAADGGKADIYQDTASLVLFERAILRVEGYQARDARAPEALRRWRGCIPQEHRLFAIGLLLENIGSIAKGTFEIGTEGRSVSFVVVRDDEPSMGKRLFGVTHGFCAPTADHRRRFLCAATQIPASYRALVSLYDELAVSAEGYSFSGAPIAPEHLRREMILPHKLYAISALFFSLGDCGPAPRRTRAVTLPAGFLETKNAVPTPPRVEVH